MGCYFPKYELVNKRVTGKGYGKKHQWYPFGKDQAKRIKQAQFEQNTKLCLNILKAVDQETVDFKNDREL